MSGLLRNTYRAASDSQARPGVPATSKVTGLGGLAAAAATSRHLALHHVLVLRHLVDAGRPAVVACGSVGVVK
jgi:hypothetical protein